MRDLTVPIGRPSCWAMTLWDISSKKGTLQKITLLLRQVGQRPMQTLCILQLFHLGIGGRRIIGDEGRIVQIEFGTAIAAVRIDSEISGNSEYPGGDVASCRIEEGGLVPDRHHCFLHQFLGGLRVTHLP